MDSTITGLTAITTIDDSDLLVGVDVSDTTMSANGTTRKFTKSNLIKEVVADITTLETSDADGWIELSETWTRTGNHTFTVATGLTSRYRKGAKVRYKDGGSYEYGYIISSSYSAPNTTVTLATNTDYTMAATTITVPAISYIENPVGFPLRFNFTLSGSGITIGNGTVTSFFNIVGRVVQMHFRWIFGSTSSMSNGVFNLPVNANASYTGQKNIIGNANVSDSSPATGYQAFCRIESSTTGRALIANVAGTYPTTAGITSTVPITWTTNDELICDMAYIME